MFNKNKKRKILYIFFSGLITTIVFIFAITIVVTSIFKN